MICQCLGPDGAPVAKALEKLHLRPGNRAGGTVRLEYFSGLILFGLLAAPAAFAQQAKFDPIQCEGRTAQDCNDLMGSFELPPQERQKVLLTRATALLQKHDLEGSIAEYREMTVIDPHSLIAYSTLGFLESIGEKWTDAVADLKRAAEIAPDQDRIHAMLAVALAKSGDCDSAKASIAQAKANTKDAASLTTAEESVRAACP
jgi:tetratricopeptide (TPR) repeat protein